MQNWYRFCTAMTDPNLLVFLFFAVAPEKGHFELFLFIAICEMSAFILGYVQNLNCKTIDSPHFNGKLGFRE
jgi:hypothetical protein